jgi:HPt (histidine-containing phosphotransfer) domain-containing protein
MRSMIVTDATNGIPPDDVVVFDLAQALRVTGDDREILVEIIEVYLEDLEHMMGEVRKSLDAGDSPGVELHAHSLKGAAANVGGQRVRAVAQGMERAGKAGNIDEARALLPALEAESERFAEHLRGLDLQAL